MASKIWTAATRKKRIEDNVHELERVLTLKDLVVLGVGSTLGLGAYVLAATIAKNDAGPAVCLSFVFAAISSAMSGLCYAEFAARVPKAGSTYVFCYASVGECIAFLIGWNVILGSTLGTASVAKGLSGYIDSLCNKTIKTTMTDIMPISSDFLAPYPDVLALGLVAFMTAIFSLGVKESSMLQGIFSTLNLAALAIAIVAGATKADFKNWNISVDNIAPKYKEIAGSGGFLPFGIGGVMSGGTKCFFSYGGFDSPAVTGAEAKNPKRDIPLAIMISLILVFFVYFAISAVLTLATPYYLQDEDAPFSKLFESYGWYALKWIVSLGAVFALSSSMMGCVFYLPRVLYAMANDGLIFKCLARVNKRTKTITLAIVIPGVVAALLAAFVNIEPLVDVLTLQGLLQYVVMAICVVVLRYKSEDTCNQISAEKVPGNILHFINQVLNKSSNSTSSDVSSITVNYCILIYTLCTGFLCYTITNGYGYLPQYLFVAILVIAIIIMLTMLLVIFRQPENGENLYFKVPWVPLIPGLSILFNTYLCTQMTASIVIIVIGWMFVGLIVYYFYGISHSEENPKKKKKYLEKHTNTQTELTNL